MRKLNYVIILFLLVTLMPLVLSQQVYKQDTVVDLKVPCFNNNTYCSSAALCNITIIDFDDVALVDNLEMSFNPAYYNYTLDVTNTTTPGEYRVSVICNDAGMLGHSTFNYIITPTGKAMDTSSAIVQGLILIIMFGVTIFFLIFATITDVPGVKLFFNVISYITMFLTVGTGYIMYQSSGIQNNISSTLSGLIFIIGMVLIVIMFYIFINQTRHALALMRARKGFGSEYDNPPVF